MNERKELVLHKTPNTVTYRFEQIRWSLALEQKLDLSARPGYNSNLDFS